MDHLGIQLAALTAVKLSYQQCHQRECHIEPERELNDQVFPINFLILVPELSHFFLNGASCWNKLCTFPLKCGQTSRGTLREGEVNVRSMCSLRGCPTSTAGVGLLAVLLDCSPLNCKEKDVLCLEREVSLAEPYPQLLDKQQQSQKRVSSFSTNLIFT